jgi:GNAT superfamily N-acetyltransferase
MKLDPRSEATHPRYEVITDDRGRAQLEELLALSFPVPKGASFFDDFPVWDSPGVTRIGGYVGDRLVTSAAVRTSYFKASHRPFKAGLVGAVSTHPEFRGQGLASHAVSLALNWAIDQGAALVALWGSEHSLYRKLGFELAGAQFRTPLASLTLPRPAAGSPIGRGWVPSLFPLLQRRVGGCVLHATDEAWLARHKNVEWYWIGSPKAPRAYAALGRGIDLEGIVHEWGGEPEAVRELLGFIAGSRPDASVIGTASALLEHGFDSDATLGEYLAMMRVSDASAILNAFGIEGGLKGAPGELARVLFGPERAIADSPFTPVLPLPLWIWGLDAC